MNFQAWIAVGVVCLCLGLLVTERLAAELVMLLGLMLLLATGVLSPAQALAGFANEGMVTVALMYVVAAALRETGAIDMVVHNLLGRPRSAATAQLRVMLPTLGMSAFINNTPVVATFLPAIMTWSRRIGVAPSRLLIPLSYAAILGGTCTLLGTSTNLVVNGMWTSAGKASFSMFELAWVGIPTAIAGIGFLILFGARLLPDRRSVEQAFDNPREYTVEMTVEEGGLMVGSTIAEAGLRNLGSLFLIEIIREGNVVPAVNSGERLRANDRLVFAGDVGGIVDLQRMRGLAPALTERAALARQYPERRLVEVVLSPRCPLIGQTLREGRFHTFYGASVIAVARDGRRIPGSLGDIRLRAADTLLVEARPVWVDRHRLSPDFLLVSAVEDSEAPRFDRAARAWAILAAIVITASLGWVDMLTAAMVGAGALLATGCVSLATARKSIDPQVLLVIACSFGIGKALAVTGAAGFIAQAVLSIAGDRPMLALVLSYIVTSLMTSVITNNAAAALMFPILMATAAQLDVSPTPFIVALMMGASASFATPLGYQTNLMVSGPGGYRFVDFLRVGGMMNVLTGVVAVVVIPMIWPF